MTDIVRVDGRLKVTGAATYAADTKIDRLSYGYLVTSTIGLGTVTSMDTTAARKSPGVLAVYTPFDPLKLFTYTDGVTDELLPVLQDAGIRYHGQVIGMVVAESFEQARDAAALIVTGYQQGKPSVSFADGLSRAVPAPQFPVFDVLAPGVKSIDDALKASEVTVSATYTTPVENHNAMEPHATVASWSGDHVTLYSATQGVLLAQAQMAKALGVDAAKVHVINPYVGGGFGGKYGNWAHVPLTAAAARALGRPVKTVLTREQVFTVVGHRPPTSQTVSLGAAKDGTLKALKHDGVSSKSVSSNSYEQGAFFSLTAYATPNLHLGSKIVELDVPVTTIMRAPSEACGSFALESAIDELAVKLGMDPLVLRQRNNANADPSNGLPWSSKHLDECYRVGAEKFGWSKPIPKIDGDWLVGKGMATATYPAQQVKATMKVRLRADGTAVAAGTAADLGTGQATVVAILAAERLGIPVGRVVADIGDSATPSAAEAAGSQSTASNGAAVVLAADAVKTALVKEAVSNPASPFHGKDPATVSYDRGFVRCGGVAISFGSLLTTMDSAGIEATGTNPGTTDDKHSCASFGAHFCEVRVNRWTGEPRVSRWVCVVDAGRIVNVRTARNQLMGSIVMGVGQALLEEGRLEPDTGRFANANLASYLMPVNADIPHLDVHMLDHPDTTFSPVGARGIGELGIVGVAAAVANAVHDATGRRIRDLPISLDKLL